MVNHVSEDVSAAPKAVAPAGPFAAVTGGSRRWVLAAVLSMMFMIAIEGTIVATAMPTIVGHLGGFELFSWVFTAYLLIQAITTPIYGRLADLYGRKRVLLFAIAVFLAGSVLCGFAWSMPSLITFRVVQGVGAGALQPIGLTLIGDLFTAPERARMQALLSSVWATASLLGPLVGAVLVAHFVWQSVFWINIPVGLIAALMLVVMLRERVARRRHAIDYVGAALLTLGVGGLMYALVEAPRLGASAAGGIGAASLVVLALLFLHERRTAEPMLPLVLWRNPVIAAGNVASLGLGAILMGGTAFLPAYVQGVMGRSAMVAGVTLTAMTVAWSVGSGLAGRILLRSSYRRVATGGGAFILAGSLALVALDPERGPVWAGFGAFITGFGMGLTNNPFLVAIQSAVDWSQRGIATSSVVFMRMMGQSLGTAVFAGIVNAGVAHLPGGGDIASRIMEPGLRNSLPPAEAGATMAAIAAALHNVFVIDAALAVVILATPFWLPSDWSPVRAARKSTPA